MYETWHPRKESYDNMPTGCKCFAVIENATHLQLGGLGFSKEVERLTVSTIVAFIHGVLDKKCKRPAPQKGITIYSK